MGEVAVRITVNGQARDDELGQERARESNRPDQQCDHDDACGQRPGGTEYGNLDNAHAERHRGIGCDHRRTFKARSH